MRITQVLDNLVTNALRYGGPNVHVSAVRTGQHVRLTVSDDGDGVPKDLIDSLFQAYVHGKASHSHGGSGLGLLIVRQLCEAMSGTIEYDDTEGTRFTVTLPALPVPRGDRRRCRGCGPLGHLLAHRGASSPRASSPMSRTAWPRARPCSSRQLRHTSGCWRRLEAIGIDHAAATATGQLVAFDADALHEELPGFHHIDRERFDLLIGEDRRAGQRALDDRSGCTARSWTSTGAASEVNLALELETCWNELRARIPFPLLCSYEVAPGENAAPICACHETVLAA